MFLQDPQKPGPPKGISKTFIKCARQISTSQLNQQGSYEGPNSKYKINLPKKNKISKLQGGDAMGLKSRKHQNNHLQSLLGLHTIFQLHSSIQRGKQREDEPLFKVKKKENSHISSPHCPRGLTFGQLHNFGLYIAWTKKKQFLRFQLLDIPLPNLGITKFRPKVNTTPEYQLLTTDFPNLIDFG